MYARLSLLLLLANIVIARPRNLQEQPKNIFLLAGQSNMAGRGGVNNNTITQRPEWDGIIPAECQPEKDILRLDAELTWVAAQEPLHKDIDSNRTNGIGPAMPFARALLVKNPSFGVIGLVPCAYGGSRIADWQPGKDLYEKLIKRAKAAIKSGGELKGLLWWQGGADSKRKEDAESYKANLVNFFNRVRSDLNSPDLPIIQVAISPVKGVAISPGKGEYPYTDLVRQIQLELKLQNLYTVYPPQGLSMQRDGVHYTAESQVKVGQLLADTYYSIKKHA